MKKIQILVKKELSDILRDKKTIIIMLVIPMLVYPLMMIGMSLGMSMIMQKENEKIHIVGYDAQYENVVEDLRRIYRENEDEFDSKIEFTASSKKEGEYVIWLDINKENEDIHAFVEYSSSESEQKNAQSTISEIFSLYCKEKVAENLKKEGLSENFINPVTLEKNDIASKSEKIGLSIGGSLGMMLVVMILLSAFYPSVDATTGERERGTLETLLTLPVSNFQMILSKYLAVSIISLIAAVISLISLFGSVFFMMTQFTTDQVIDFGGFDTTKTVVILLVMMLVVISSAFLMTALSMCFCIFAKTNKEANNYMTPVMFIVMIASMVGMIPSIKLNEVTSLIPLVNVSLLVKSVMSQEADIALAFISIVINLAFSVLIIWVLSKLYKSENVLFSDGFSSIRLFQKRSDIKEGTVPEIGDVIIGIAVTLMLILYVGTAVSIRNIMIGTVVNQIIILAVPIFMMWYLKMDRKKLFSLKRPSFNKSVIGSLVLFAGIYILMNGITPILASVFEESTKHISESFEMIMDYPFIICLLVICVMPAIGEELFFRGMIYGCFRNKFGVNIAIISSAAIFGLYHMSLVKFFTTGLLGLCFAYILEVTGSIYVTMALHFINNFVSLWISKYGEKTELLNRIFSEEQLSSGKIAIIIVVGIILTGLGYILTAKKQEVKE